MQCKSLFSPGETIYKNFQSLFSGKNKKKYFKMSFAEILPSMQSIKDRCGMEKRYSFILSKYHDHIKDVYFFI